MLNVIFHPMGYNKTVNDADYEQALRSGEWFDSPVKAAEARKNAVQEIRTQEATKKNKAAELELKEAKQPKKEAKK